MLRYFLILFFFFGFWFFVCHNVSAHDSSWLGFYLFCWWFCSLVYHLFVPPNIFTFLHGIPFVKPYKTIVFTTRHDKSTVRFHLISSFHHCRARRIRSFLLLCQRSQQAGWVAAFGPIAAGMGVLEVEEVGWGAWWCLVWVDIPYPSGRSPWTSGTVRGQKQEGGCCKPSVLPPSGRTRPQRVLTASRSTSQKPRLDFEHWGVSHPPPHLLSPLWSWPVDQSQSFSGPSFGSSVGHCYLLHTLPSALPLLHLPQLQIHFSCSLNKQW